MKKHKTVPFVNMWFGNFYKPAFDDRGFIVSAMAHLKKLGFDHVQLDAKAWEDFEERYQGMVASPYVEMQEFMMAEANKQGIGYNFLALYLNGDNLYPNIRFSLPIYGETVVTLDQQDGKWYRYWSEKAQESMIHHVKGLLKTYHHEGHSKICINQEERVPICSMWDPIVAPSFDKAGKNRYQEWLCSQYNRDIQQLNHVYGTTLSDFEDVEPEIYWFQARYGESAMISEEDIHQRNVRFTIWCDNMKWKRFELVSYFKCMQERFRALDVPLYLNPNLTQWSYFLNVDGRKLSGVGFSELWDTAMRGIDVFELAPFVDNCGFITVPITMSGDADAYVVSLQHRMMAAMNPNREFIGGLYLGRFLYNDIYQTVSPCEVIASIVASGAKGYNGYGYCGLDDGGVLHRMDDGFNNSLTVANEWAKQVIPLTGKRIKSEVAILFPNAMAAFEPLQVEGSEERRLDFLGMDQALCDLGVTPDVIDICMIENDALKAYKVLFISANDCYFVERHPEAEKRVSDWVASGGVVIHGPNDQLISEAIGIKGKPHGAESMVYDEGVLLNGTEFESFEEMDGPEGQTACTLVVATYKNDHKPAVISSASGLGTVYSFGFHYGYAYRAKTAPHVPLSEKNNALYPVSLMKSNMLKDILKKHLSKTKLEFQKNIEISYFQNGVLLVNHTSHPYELSETLAKQNNYYFQYKVNDTTVLGRSGVWMGYK